MGKNARPRRFGVIRERAGPLRRPSRARTNARARRRADRVPRPRPLVPRAVARFDGGRFRRAIPQGARRAGVLRRGRVGRARVVPRARRPRGGASRRSSGLPPSPRVLPTGHVVRQAPRHGPRALRAPRVAQRRGGRARVRVVQGAHHPPRPPLGHQRRGHRDSEQDRRSTRRRARTLVRLARRRLPRLRGAISARPGRRAPRPIRATPPGARRRPGRPPRRRTHRRHPRRCSRATPRVARPILDDERGHTERGHTDPRRLGPRLGARGSTSGQPRTSPEREPRARRRRVRDAPRAVRMGSRPDGRHPTRVRARWGGKERGVALSPVRSARRDVEFPPARRGRRVDASPVDGSRVDGSRVVGSRVVGAPFPEEETEGERCGFDWRVGGRVQREHPRERDGARGFGGRRSPAREPGTQPGSRAPRFLHRGWRVALRRDARVRRRGDVPSPRVRRRRDARIALRKVSRRGGGVGVSLGPGRPSAREGDARPRRRHHPDTHRRHHPDTHTHRARAPTETETDSGLSAAKRKRDDARNVAAGSTSGAVLRASSVGGFHPIRRHRAHCPWIVVHADVDPTVATGGSLPAAPAGLRPGWLCVLDAVAPAGLGEDAGEPDVSGLPSASEEGGAGGGGAGGGVATPPGKLKDFSMYGGRAAVASYLTGNG